MQKSFQDSIRVTRLPLFAVAEEPLALEAPEALREVRLLPHIRSVAGDHLLPTPILHAMLVGPSARLESALNLDVATLQELHHVHRAARGVVPISVPSMTRSKRSGVPFSPSEEGSSSEVRASVCLTVVWTSTSRSENCT